MEIKVKEQQGLALPANTDYHIITYENLLGTVNSNIMAGDIVSDQKIKFEEGEDGHDLLLNVIIPQIAQWNQENKIIVLEKNGISYYLQQKLITK